MHDFTVGHPLVVEGVNLVQQKLDLFVVFEEIHLVQEISELVFGDDAVLVLVNLLEKICKGFQEALMLPELVIQDSLLEIAVK